MQQVCTSKCWFRFQHRPYFSFFAGIIHQTFVLHKHVPHSPLRHSFVDPNDPLAIPENDLNHFNVNWGGVRSSKLPYALEPSAADTLDFDDVNAVGNLPICPWTGPAQRGRAEPKNLPSTGGYTTFVEGGLLVNQTFAPLLPPCRKPNVTCGTTVDPNLSCMVESCTQTQIDTQGYVRMELKVAINSSPNCVSESWLWNGMVQLRCDFHDTGVGRIVASLTSYNTCAPWTDIGLINGRTGQGLNIFYLRNWATSPSNKQLFFVVHATDKIAAETAVNSMFNNVGQTTELAIELRALRKNHSYFTSPGTTIQPPTASIPYEFLPAEYDPRSLNAFTFVYGKGEDYGTGGVDGLGRRRIGDTTNIGGRDTTVFSVNWQSGARLQPSSTYTNRGYYFASNLGSVKETAASLRVKVAIDQIELEQWAPRRVRIYKRGTTFVAQAASSPKGVSTTCGSLTASLACSGWSTPKAGHVPYFYVKCQNSTYFGPNPYNFSPSFGSRFPGHGNTLNQSFVRSYVCDGMIRSGRKRALSAYAEDEIDDFRAEDVDEVAAGSGSGDPVPFARPTWKMMGFFPIGDASCASLEADTYAESVCDPDTISSPTPKPTSCIALDQNYGRMPVGKGCPCGGSGCWGADTTGQCCSGYCRITNLGSSFCRATPTPTSRPTTSPTSCILLDQNYGRMPVGNVCPCGGSGCWGADTTGQCCSGYCRITDLGSSFCRATPTPTSRPTTIKPTMCIVSSVNNGRMRPLVCECGVPGCISNSDPRCCSGKCMVNLYNVSFCKD